MSFTMPMSPRLLRVALVVLFPGSFCLGQAATLATPDFKAAGRPGVLVDPATYGPSVVETMQTVLERQQATGTQPKLVSGSRNGAQGTWFIPSRRDHPPAHSEPHALINKWGDTCMAIGFGRLVDFEGAWFAGQAAPGVWTTGIRIVGFRAGVEVSRSAWCEKIRQQPHWFAADLKRVDRIEIQSRAVRDGGGWYSLDDLTYRLPTIVGQEKSAKITVDFDDLTYRQDLTGTQYAGLDWQIGTGPFEAFQPKGPGGITVIPAPRSLGTDVGTSRPDAGGGPRMAAARNGGTAPNLVKSQFGAKLGDPGGGAVPPDTCGACGIDHFVSVVNFNFSVFQKSDLARVVNVGNSSFWGTVVADPRVIFDPDSNRYFSCAAWAGKVYLAVSLTSDPTGSWFKTSWKSGVGSDAGTWPDFPTLGVDKRGVYMAALMVGRSTMTLWAIHKAPLLSATPSLGTVTAWRGLPWEGGIQPCLTYGDDGGCWLVSRYDSDRLHLRRVQGPLASTPKLLDGGPVSVPYHVGPPYAPSLGGSVGLATGDFRPSFAVFRNGSIWVAQTVDVNGRAACRWYEIDVKTKRTIQVGTVRDPVRHYFYPSISVNARGDVAMGFSGSHAGEYAGAWFTGRLAGDPPGEMGPPRVLQAGLGPYNIITGTGVVRWGDYSATTVDPVDERTFWTLQEFAGPNPSAGGGIWATKLGRLDFAFFRYGDGWPGTIGVPELRRKGVPYLGTTPSLELGNSLGAMTRGWLTVGPARASIPLLDGTLLVLPVVTVGLVLPATGRSLPVSIPNDPTLLNQSFFLQLMVVDPGASKGLAFSRGLEGRIGR